MFWFMAKTIIHLADDTSSVLDVSEKTSTIKSLDFKIFGKIVLDIRYYKTQDINHINCDNIIRTNEAQEWEKENIDT